MAMRLLPALMLLVLPTSAGTAEQCSCDTDVQTALLRQRIEAQRGIPADSVELAFTPLNFFPVTSYSFAALRGPGCLLVLDKDEPGLIDILLRAKPVVGYPESMADFHPDAGFGIFFSVNQPYEFDLWFSNPLRPAADQPLVLVGQSHDFPDRNGIQGQRRRDIAGRAFEMGPGSWASQSGMQTYEKVG